MARLYLSHSIRSQIKNSINEPFKKRLGDIYGSILKCFDADVVFAQLVGPEHMAHMLALPEEYLRREDTFYAKMKLGDSHSSFAFKLRKPMPVPSAWCVAWQTKVHKEIPPETPNYDKALALAATWAAVEKERVNLINTIDKLLSECNTVQQVARVWPGVVQHLTAEDLAKFNERPAPRAAAPKKPERKPLPTIPDSVAVSLAKVAMLKGEGA